jgi:hypothetical protein
MRRVVMISDPSPPVLRGLKPMGRACNLPY